MWNAPVESQKVWSGPSVVRDRFGSPAANRRVCCVQMSVDLSWTAKQALG